MQDISDSLLLKRIAKGKNGAYDQLFFKYYKPLYRFAYNYCRNKAVAEESVQQAFIKVWQNLSDFCATNNACKTIFTYTKNCLIDELRKEQTRKKHESNTILNLETHQLNSENDHKYISKAIIESAIEKLPKKAKAIFQLAKQEGLTIQEIAEYLNISNKTVENQLTIAYKKLRKQLEPFKEQLNY
jgi:RNA polymerase sigma-70 factor (ECF subfamily)